MSCNKKKRLLRAGKKSSLMSAGLMSAGHAYPRQSFLTFAPVDHLLMS
jgi:hypothetical protein